jgi:hypothetical protein
VTAVAWLSLATGLSLLPAGLLLVAGGAAPHPRTRWAVGPLLGLAATTLAAQIAFGQEITIRAGAIEQALFTWSPLGLYGVRFEVQSSAASALLMLPAVVLALLGWYRARSLPRTQTLVASWCSASALIGLAGVAWAITAADLVSLHLAFSIFLLASVATLAAVAGPAQAGHRLMLVHLALVGLLGCVLLLGKINGHFQISALSSAGFRTEAFAGLLLATLVVAAVPPFHGWITRIARHPLGPALASAGLAGALYLLLIAFRTTTGDFAPAWQHSLAALGWLAALIGAGIALVRLSPPVRLAAVFAGRGGTILLAGSVATPAAMASSLLYLTTVLPALALLWLLAAAPMGERVQSRDRQVWRQPGFWLNVLLLAIAAGLPLTVGGLGRNALVNNLTSWSVGDQLLRFPVVILDAATLVAGGAVLWRPRYLLPLRGTVGWIAVVLASGVAIVPALVPGVLVAPWFNTAATEVSGTLSTPLRLTEAWFPGPFPVAFSLLGIWVITQRIRRKEWLPGIGRTFMGAAALGWLALRRRWRQRGHSAAPAAAGDAVWRRIQQGAERVMATIQPFEERYYAGVAVLVAVAMIYIIGR